MLYSGRCLSDRLFVSPRCVFWSCGACFWGMWNTTGRVWALLSGRAKAHSYYGATSNAWVLDIVQA